ncbi:MAG: TetR/AcrR family transcriptional regulator [Roseburia sp.]|nr:TetR/AcrR family transcriptional regulator [Roseburia sp.]MCM1279131.1 TetR/AcrR family transcriptional regulator [Robinsoniella sp.]
MARAGLDKNIIVRKTAQLANEIGVENVTLKMLADNLNIQTPSLYNHIKGLEDLQRELMIYGWKQMAEAILNAVAGVNGYDALEALCHAFYRYAIQNPGVFNAMLWYNKYQNKVMLDSTERIFSIVYKITASLNIPKETCNHLIRTFHGFLEGFSLLVNNAAFGNPSSLDDSFDLSLKVLIAGIKELETNK